MQQRALTIITEIDDAQRSQVEQALAGLEESLRTGRETLFHHSESTHFARWVILEPYYDPNNRKIPSRLVFSANHDGHSSDYLRDLLRIDSQIIDDIYSPALGYPPLTERSFEARLTFLMEHLHSCPVFYVGLRGYSVRNIHRESRLRLALQAEIDRLSAAERRSMSSKQLRDRLIQFVANDPRWRWALKDEPLKAPSEQLMYWGRLSVLTLLSITLIGVFWLPLAILVAATLWSQSRYRHRVSHQVLSQNRNRLRDLEQHENKITQNQMSSIVPIKNHWSWRFGLRFGLFAVDTLARYHYNKGRLGSIDSIHFARWLMIDDDQHLLFFTNYDGSWESYLGDFVDRAWAGLNIIWRNAEHYPPTKCFFRGGAQNEQAFKAYARASQIKTHFWYSAYKSLSVSNIKNNYEIRRGLVKKLNPSQLSEWLRRF